MSRPEWEEVVTHLLIGPPSFLFHPLVCFLDLPLSSVREDFLHFTVFDNSCHNISCCKQHVEAGGMQAEDLRIVQICSVQICRESVGINAGLPLRCLIQKASSLNYKVKVLLRSQSKLIPPLFVYSRPAYGDTKWRSMSITDGAAQESKAQELTLICVLNQLAVTAELTWVAANVSQRSDLKSVCWNNIKMTEPLQQSIRSSVTWLILTPWRWVTIILIALVFSVWSYFHKYWSGRIIRIW